MSIQSISSSLPQQASPDVAVLMRERARVAAPPAEKAAAPERRADLEELKAAVSSVREYVQPFNSNLEFSINDDTDQVVVKIIDTATKEVIRQIPSEEMLAIAEALDSLIGLFLKQTA